MSVTGFAQANATAVALKIDIDEMALVTRGITEVTFDLQAPQVAGGKVTVVAVTPSDYVQSTMIEQGDGSGISVQGGSVAVSVSGLSAAFTLKCQTYLPANGVGAIGDSELLTPIEIGTSPVTAFSSVGSHYTGTGGTDGYQFVYSLEINDGDYGDINANLFNTSGPIISYILQN